MAQTHGACAITSFYRRFDRVLEIVARKKHLRLHNSDDAILAEWEHDVRDERGCGPR
jgi:hypothetical protein